MDWAKLLIVSTGLTAVGSIAYAQNCAVKPDCEAMGYTQSETDCNGMYLIRCPFETSKVYCGGRTCVYTNATKPANCAEASSCVYEGATYYSDTCTACDSGYSLVEGSCVAACSYTNTTSPSNCSSVDSCSKNGTTYYACTSCKSGYKLKNDGTCCNNECEGSYEGPCEWSISTSNDGCGNTCYYCGYYYEAVYDTIIENYCSYLSSFGWSCTCRARSSAPCYEEAILAWVGNGEYATEAECTEACVRECQEAMGHNTWCTEYYLIK